MFKLMGERTRYADNTRDAGVRSLDIPTDGLVLHCPFKDVNDTHAATGQPLDYHGSWKNWRYQGLDAISMVNCSTESHIIVETAPASDGTYFDDTTNPITAFTNCAVSFWLFDFTYYSGGESFYFQPCKSGINYPNESNGLTWKLNSRYENTRQVKYESNGNYGDNYIKEKLVWCHIFMNVTQRQVIQYYNNEPFSQYDLVADRSKMYRWLFMRRVHCAMRDFRLYNRPLTADERMALWLEHSEVAGSFTNLTTGAT